MLKWNETPTPLPKPRGSRVLIVATLAFILLTFSLATAAVLVVHSEHGQRTVQEAKTEALLHAGAARADGIQAKLAELGAQQAAYTQSADEFRASAVKLLKQAMQMIRTLLWRVDQLEKELAEEKKHRVQDKRDFDRFRIETNADRGGMHEQLDGLFKRVEELDLKAAPGKATRGER